MADDAKPEPTIRVVDRRWWARTDDADTATSSSTKPTYVEELERQLAEKSAKLQTAFSEFEQVKVRLRRDVAREVERARRAMLTDLLEVLDNLDRALDAVASDGAASGSALQRGVELVRAQFLAKLEAFGVARFDATGQRFDVNQHEAVGMASVADSSQDGLVVTVVKEGYAIGGEVLRPAAVIVGQYVG